MAKKVSKKPAELTLESIQKMLERVFDPKFESIDKRFNSVDKKFESVDKKFESVDKRFEIFELRIVLAFNRKMDEIKDYMVEQRSEIASIKDEIMGELKIIREEQTILNGRSAKINQIEDRMEDLEKIHPHGHHLAS